MFTILMMIMIIVCCLLMIVVLMQSSKGTGLSGAFGGAGGMGTVFGVRRTSDFLTRSTWVLAITFVVLCIGVNLFFLPTGATQESLIRKSAQEQPLSPLPQQQAPIQTPGAGQPAQGQQQSTPAPAQKPPQK